MFTAASPELMSMGLNCILRLKSQEMQESAWLIVSINSLTFDSQIHCY